MSTSPAQLRYVHPQAIAFYVLTAPAIMAELVLAQGFQNNSEKIAAGIAILTSPIPFIRILVEQAVQALPWIVVLASIFTLLTFRPSTLVTLLTFSFLVLTAATEHVDYVIASMVVGASFLALIGFSYGRAAKVLAGRTLKEESRGPLLFRVVSLSLDLALPVGAALGLMALVSLIIETIRVQAGILPEPLSTIGLLFLRSQLFLTLTIMIVAGAAVWAMHHIIEPIILMFTLSHQDALKEALSEINDPASKVARGAQRRPGLGKAPVILSLLGLALVTVYLTMTGGPGNLLNNFLSILGIERIEPSRSQLLVENFAKNTVRLVNESAVAVEEFVKFLIRLLWG